MRGASTQKVREVAGRLGKSVRTIWRWVRAGCDLANEKSVQQFVEASQLRKTNVEKSRERRAAFNGSNGSSARTSGRPNQPDLERLIAGELPPPGRRGAAAALQRLEEAEEQSHARLLKAMDQGNPLEIQEVQEFWLKCIEALRRLDLAIEVSRRDSEEQIPKRQAEEISLFTAEWLRIAFAQFLSSEGSTLIGIKKADEWQAYALDRFWGIIELTLKTSLQTRSPIPSWAADKVREAWKG